MNIFEFVSSTKSVKQRKRKLFSGIKPSKLTDSLIWNSDDHCLNTFLALFEFLKIAVYLQEVKWKKSHQKHESRTKKKLQNEVKMELEAVLYC